MYLCVGWVSYLNPTNALGFASLNPTYKGMAYVLLNKRVSEILQVPQEGF
jgi:hypothetical protein